MFEPARWPDRVQLAVLWTVAGALFISGFLLAATPWHLLTVALFPPLIGGLIWRYDGRPWLDIASWTVPAMLWVGVVAWLGPSGLMGGLVASVAVAGWVYLFIFWTRVTRWWYRWVLRKRHPNDLG
ncbi:MAG TPA: hypothetical protein VFK36_14785 [Gemmatimonadales bacterium]|nr:hypothetical protein [Gemmatimonadales bacterium]